MDRSIARIRAYAHHMGWTRNRLATEARLAESTIRNIDQPTWSPTADTLRQLEAIIPEDFQLPGEDEASPDDEPSSGPPKEAAA